MRRLLLLLLPVLAAGPLARATVYYVDGARPDNTGAGTGWASAKKDVQEAINLATTDGDEVWVKAGTYLPTYDISGSASPADPRDKVFYISAANIKLYGGFAGTETAAGQRNAATNTTVLSGDLDGSAGTADAYHVLAAVQRSAACAVDGFTVTGGRANGNNSVFFGSTATWLPACSPSTAPWRSAPVPSRPTRRPAAAAACTAVAAPRR